MTSEIVKIKNVDSNRYKEHVPVFVTPTLDALHGVLIVGQRRFQTEMREGSRAKDGPIHVAVAEVDGNNEPIGKVPMELTEETQIAILPGEQYDMRNAADRLVIDMLKASEFYVENEQMYNPASLQRVTLDDPMRSARLTNKKADYVFKALEMLRNQTATGRADLAFMLKQPAMRMTAEQIDAYLNSVAVDTPALLLELFDKSDFEARVLIRRCVQMRLLTQRGDAIYNGETCIGLDEDQAIAWLKQPANDNFVASLIGKLRSENMHSEGVLERPTKRGRQGGKKEESFSDSIS